MYSSHVNEGEGGGGSEGQCSLSSDSFSSIYRRRYTYNFKRLGHVKYNVTKYRITKRPILLLNIELLYDCAPKNCFNVFIYKKCNIK